MQYTYLVGASGFFTVALIESCKATGTNLIPPLSAAMVLVFIIGVISMVYAVKKDLHPHGEKAELIRKIIFLCAASLMHCAICITMVSI